LSERPRLAASAPIPLLVSVAAAELVINRLVVPALRPVQALGEAVPVVPGWFRALDYLGLFLFYFTATLAVVSLLRLLVAALPAWRAGGERGAVLATMVGATTVVALVLWALLVGGLGPDLSLALELGLATLALGAVARAVRPPIVLGTAIGVTLLALPILIHAYGVVAARWLWPDGGQGGQAVANLRLGVAAMVLLAVASPYTLGPRPLARAMTRLASIGVALSVSLSLLVLLRFRYELFAELGNVGLGLGLRREAPDPRLAMFVLGAATLAWTLASCALDDLPGRRRLGMGLALVVLCGTGLTWPAYIAVVAVGLIVVGDELGHLQRPGAVRTPVVTPPIDDGVWQGYVAQVVAALRARGAKVQALTTRGRDDDATTVIVGAVAARPLTLRVHRSGGSVVAIDARFGRDLIAERRPPTFSLVTRRDQRFAEAHAEPPAGGGPVKLGDARFDARFRCRGDLDAIGAMLDDDTRDRLLLGAEGWLAVWMEAGVRSVVHPGRGASLDQPLPLAELAARGQVADAPARLLGWLDMLAALAERTMPPEDDQADDAPAEGEAVEGEGPAS
jgi:hypothetical protein